MVGSLRLALAAAVGPLHLALAAVVAAWLRLAWAAAGTVCPASAVRRALPSQQPPSPQFPWLPQFPWFPWFPESPEFRRVLAEAPR
ncbi:MAG TPA: hypothetical protein VGS97_11410 [Actinocrinis sp.]|uniref:hypothetical protein n=1 Tax=Actinocrinis sp. TaxID=1920516 RepID=UPI002DDD7FB8|nr:hypothetical protein [Actinocrinis sp.]HEV2344693.1 hypothetical protein [Actinocrinis sp.]